MYLYSFFLEIMIFFCKKYLWKFDKECTELAYGIVQKWYLNIIHFQVRFYVFLNL